jgi:hypothetical protein
LVGFSPPKPTWSSDLSASESGCASKSAQKSD